MLKKFEDGGPQRHSRRCPCFHGGVAEEAQPKFDAAFAEKITALALHHVVRAGPWLPTCLPRCSTTSKLIKCGRDRFPELMDLSAGFEEPRVGSVIL